MTNFTTRFLLKSSFSTSFVKLSTQFYSEDNAMMKAFNKYTEAKLEDAAIKKETKRNILAEPHTKF